MTRSGYSTEEIQEIHQEDLADETRITVELNVPVVTRSQSVQLALKQTLIQDPLTPLHVVLTTVLDLLLPPSENPPQSFISSRDRLLDTPLTSLPELDLARTPPTATGPMVVVGYNSETFYIKDDTLGSVTSPPE